MRNMAAGLRFPGSYLSGFADIGQSHTAGFARDGVPGQETCWKMIRFKFTPSLSLHLTLSEVESRMFILSALRLSDTPLLPLHFDGR